MKLYCRYITGLEADAHSVNLFAHAIAQHKADLTTSEAALLQVMLQYPRSIPFIDAALGLFYAEHILRKRMIVAFAILETNPAYYSFFQPRQYSPLYILRLGIMGVLQVIKALIGKLIMMAV